MDLTLETAEGLVNAHEILICAEVECYIRSKKGKTALRCLHRGKKYGSLDEGMSYPEAVAIFGGEGVDVTSEEARPSGRKTYSWRDDDGKKVFAVFGTDGKLISNTKSKS
jgi:hypothetical protein